MGEAFVIYPGFCNESPDCVIEMLTLRQVTTKVTVGYFLVPAFLANQICRESPVKWCFLKLSAFFTSETSYVFSITFITPSTRFYPLNGRTVWSQVCTSLLLAILCGKINYKACSSDPLWILTLSQKQFSLRGYQEEVKGLPIKQTYITEKGQKTGKHSKWVLRRAILSASPMADYLRSVMSLDI